MSTNNYIPKVKYKQTIIKQEPKKTYQSGHTKTNKKLRKSRIKKTLKYIKTTEIKDKKMLK